MQDFQQRVVDEEAEVKEWQIRTNERKIKLLEFIGNDNGPFKTLPKDEQVRLVAQANAMHNLSRDMEAYRDLLTRRIAAFE